LVGDVLIDFGFEALALGIDGWVRFEKQFAIDPGDLHGVVDEAYGRADWNQRKQCFDIAGIHADAAVGDGEADGSTVA
jgi:hypothetical protein